MFPSFDELFKEFSAKFQQVKPKIDPTVKGSWPLAFGRGVSAIGYSLVILGKELLKQFNPLTATGRFLELWASYDDITILGASPSIGTINVYGVNGVIIPASTFWAGQINGLLYTNTVQATIQAQDLDQTPVAILSITRVGSIATAICSFAHGISRGRFVTISGADQSEYNGNFSITPDPTNIFVFTYIISGTPVTPATGSPYSAVPIRTITAMTETSGIGSAVTDFDHGFVDGQYVSISNASPSAYNDLFLITVTGAKTFEFDIAGGTGPTTSTPAGLVRSVHAAVNVQSEDNGPETIVAALGLLDMQEPVVASADITATTVEGLQGGAVVESDDALRARMLLSRSSVAGVFTNDQIELAAKLINGNTDVFIQNPNTVTLAIDDPNAVFPGQVKIYILRKNDPSGSIPTGGVLEATKLSIVLNAGLPADVWIEDIFVLAPELTPINITMTNVLPDTATMRSAIKSQFQAYFDDEAELGENLDNDILRGVAIETQDLNSGIPEESFINRFDWTNIQIDYAIILIEDSGGDSKFSFVPGPTDMQNGQTVILSNMEGSTFAILSPQVDDGNGFVQFNFTPGPTLTIGREVIVTGFLAGSTYNGTFIITAQGAGFFVVAVTFAGNQGPSGRFEPNYNGTFVTSVVGDGFFEIAIPFLDNDQLGEFATESEVISGAALPVLGVLTVNGQEVN